MDKVQTKFYQPSDIVVDKNIDAVELLLKDKNDKTNDVNEEEFYDMYLPKFPLYLSYFLACCSLALFIAVPVLCSLLIK